MEYSDFTCFLCPAINNLYTSFINSETCKIWNGIDRDFVEYYNMSSRALGMGDMPATVLAILYIEPGDSMRT